MRLRLVVAALRVAFAPCLAAAGDVERHFDKDYDFGKVKTFATKIGTSWGNPISEKRVTTEMTEELTAKGWTPAPEGEADAPSSCTGRAESRVARHLLQRHERYEVPRVPRLGRNGHGLGDPDHHHHRVPGRGAWSWTSSTRSGRSSRSAAPPSPRSRTTPRRTKKLDKITAKMFKDFPPGSAKK